jgi:regulatory protein
MAEHAITIVECKPIGSGNRYRVTITNCEKPLLVSDELVYRHRLKAGIVITPPQLAQLEAEAEVAECDRLVARLLAMREHSIGQLKVKLAQRQFKPEIIKDVVKKYINRGILDDAHFAHNQAQQFLDKNPAGRNFLINWLRRKHIHHDLAEQTAEMLLGEQDEVALAVASLERKWNSLKHFDLERARTKAYTYLSRRGIGYAAAKAAFEQLTNRDNEAGND